MAAKLFVFYLFALLAGLTAVRTAPLVLQQRDEIAARGLLSEISNITSIASTVGILKKIGEVGAEAVAGAIGERDEDDAILGRGLISDISNLTSIADTVSILKKIGSVGAAGAATLVGAVDERDEEATAARAIDERQVPATGASGALALPNFHTIVAGVNDVASLFGSANTVAKTFNVTL